MTSWGRVMILWAAHLGLMAGSHSGEVPPLRPLRAGAVMPQGWMREQMRRDLGEGLAGAYERIWTSVSLELFAAQKRAPGFVEVRHGDEVSKEQSWWAGEHEGYWKDAMVRLAFLTGNEALKERARGWMEAILAARGPDGYIGIYSPETRFPTKGADGELWTQSRIFQAMLAYHEFTGSREVLEAVEKAAALTLATYRDKVGTYFGRRGVERDGGVSHGVGFTDTLEWLYRITGKAAFRDGAVWLYEDYSRHKVRDGDMQLGSLLDAGRHFQKHTPHIMEGLHMAQICAAFTGREDFRAAASSALTKLQLHTTPAGNIVGDEDVKGREGTGDTWGEYCSMTEGIPSLNQIVAYSGDLSVARFAERTCLNAAQAARFHPVNVAVQYLGHDDQRSADDRTLHRGRCVYAAYHRAAACCTLNSTRLLPYYVEGMWYLAAGRPALVAALFGPCAVETEVAGVPVRILEETAYPFGDAILLRVEPSRAVEFSLVVRVPDGAGDVSVEACDGAAIRKLPGRIEVSRRWEGAAEVHVDFRFSPRMERAHDGNLFVVRGPLIYSLPLPADVKVSEDLRLVGGKDSGFHAFEVTPREDAPWNYRMPKDATFLPVALEGHDSLDPWGHPPMGLRGKMRDAAGGDVEVTLLPHGSSLLRRATFPAAE